MDTGTKIPSGAGDPEGVEPSMEELRSFWDVPSRIALVIGADHRVRRANEGAVRAANRDPADIVGRTIKELMPFSRDVIEAIVDRVIASGAPASGTISAIDFAEMTLDVFPIAVRSEDPRALLIATDPRHIPFDEPDGANATRTSYFDYLQRLACVSSADSAALIEETLRYIVQTYRLKRAYVRLLTDDEAWFRTEYEYYPPEIGPVSPREITVTSIAWANERFLRGESIVLSSPDDLPSDDQDFRAALERVNVRATISVPVLDGPRLFGYVAYPAEEGRSWSTLDVNRLRLLGEVIAAVLVRNRAERDLQDRFRFEEQLAAATMRVVGIEPEAVDAELERTLAAVGASCNFDRALISRLNDAGDTVSITHEWCAPGVPSIRARFQGKRLDELSSFARRALAGEDVVGREEDAAPGSELAQLLRALQIHGIVISPLHIEGRVGGLFTVQTCGHHRFDPPAYVARVRLTADVIAAAHSERAARERARRIDAEKQRAFEAVSREKQTLERERDYLREERGSREIVGESPAIQRALDLLIAVASTTSSVLLLGESGVGKEVFAAAVHTRSARSRGPFVKVNCASVPSTLFESEFFGHAKGSFTGAIKDRAGRFGSPTGALSSSTRSARSRSTSRRSSSACSRRARSSASARIRRARSTSGSSPRPTAISAKR